MSRIQLLSAFAVLLPLSATNALAQSAAPFQVQLPGQQAVETALDGYCAVCIVEKKAWAKGDARFASIYDGKRYLFPSAAEKAVFDADPAKYAPAAGGDCVVCQVEKGAKMAGSVRHAASYDGRVFLFPNEEIKSTFLANPAKYAEADLAYDGECAVCRVEMNHRVAGSPEHTAVYEGKRYQFPSDKERQAFLANPAKYAERFGG